MRIGVLALQGAFREHKRLLEELGVAVTEVRKPEALDGLDGIILPGGESTTMFKLMGDYRFIEPLREKARQGLPIMGTCAGAILLGTAVTGAVFKPLALLDIDVDRNAFGRQVDSFEQALSVPCLGTTAFPGVFIRAPRITDVGRDVTVLASLGGSGEPVAVREGNVLAMTFHPELTADYRFHKYFLNIADRNRHRHKVTAVGSL